MKRRDRNPPETPFEDEQPAAFEQPAGEQPAVAGELAQVELAQVEQPAEPRHTSGPFCPLCKAALDQAVERITAILHHIEGGSHTWVSVFRSLSEVQPLLVSTVAEHNRQQEKPHDA